MSRIPKGTAIPAYGEFKAEWTKKFIGSKLKAFCMSDKGIVLEFENGAGLLVDGVDEVFFVNHMASQPT